MESVAPSEVYARTLWVNQNVVEVLALTVNETAFSLTIKTGENE